MRPRAFCLRAADAEERAQNFLKPLHPLYCPVLAFCIDVHISAGVIKRTRMRESPRLHAHTRFLVKQRVVHECAKSLHVSLRMAGR